MEEAYASSHISRKNLIMDNGLQAMSSLELVGSIMVFPLVEAFRQKKEAASVSVKVEEAQVEVGVGDASVV